MDAELPRALRRAPLSELGPLSWRAADVLEAQQAGLAHLRVALALACGELSTYGTRRHESPEPLMQQFLEEARRG